jgi:hypothetical protein
MKKNGMRPDPPGEILNEEFLKPLGPDGKRAREGDRGAAQPDHGDSNRCRRHHGRYGDPAGNVFQNFGGILHEPANDLRPAQRRKGSAGEGEKEHRRQQERAGVIRKTEDGKSVIVPIASR